MSLSTCQPMGDSTYSSHKTTILSSIPQKQPSLKDRDFSKLYIVTKPFNPIQHSLNHMDYKQTLSAAHMTSDIITQLHYTDLWYKSSHRQCTKELPWIYLSKGKDLILGEAHGCSEP